MQSAQSAFTCSKLTTETLEQGVKYVQSFTPCSSVSIVNFEKVNADWVTYFDFLSLLNFVHVELFFFRIAYILNIFIRG